MPASPSLPGGSGPAGEGIAFRWLLVGEAALGLVALAWALLAGETIPVALDGDVLVLSLALTALLVVANFGWFDLARRLRLTPGVFAFFDDLVFPLVRRASFLELLVAAALAGLAEELLFRGLLQPRLGLVPASLVFGLVHGPSLALLPLGLWASAVGLFFGLLYQTTGNLAPPVLVHAFYDAVALLAIRVGWRPLIGEVSMAGVNAVDFVKADAHGNDFILVPDDAVDPTIAPELARRICDRRSGVGADGLILFTSTTMKLLNSDGSAAEISGNGLRCLAALLYHRGVVDKEMTIETGAGALSLSLVSRDGARFRFRANMGPPRVEALGERIEVDGHEVVATLVSMGNPHCVVFTEKLQRGELLSLGPRLETHPRFPDRTNVELVEVVSPNSIRMAIWERGAGETASSGTGSSASAVATLANGLADSPLEVVCPGGVMKVTWEPGGDVLLEGEAALVAEGRFFNGSRSEP